MKKTILEEQSAGGVVCRKTPDTAYEFLIGKHSGYHKWVLPKGLVERGESLSQTATREVWEEVGVRAEIVGQTPVKTIEYFYFADVGEVVGKNPHVGDTERRVVKYQEEDGGKVRIHKKVTYFLMKLVEDAGSPGWEMTERQWVSYEQGVKILAFPAEQEVLTLASGLLEKGAPAGT